MYCQSKSKCKTVSKNQSYPISSCRKVVHSNFFLFGSIYLQEKPTHVSLQFRLIHICIEVEGPIFSDVCIYYFHKWKMEDLVFNDIFFEIGFCFRFLEAAQSQQSLTPKIYNATDQKDKTLYYQLIYISTPQNNLKKKTPQKSQKSVKCAISALSLINYIRIGALKKPCCKSIF